MPPPGRRKTAENNRQPARTADAPPGRSLGRMWLRRLVLKICRSAIEDGVAAGRRWSHNPFIANPARSGSDGVAIIAELGLIRRRWCPRRQCWRRPESMDHYADDDHLVAGSNHGELLRVGVSGDIHVRLVQHRGAGRAVVAGLVLWLLRYGNPVTSSNSRRYRVCCQRVR